LIKGKLHILYPSFTNMCQECMLEMVYERETLEKYPPKKITPTLLAIHANGVGSYCVLRPSLSGKPRSAPSVAKETDNINP